jgi:hypothetical protein
MSWVCPTDAISSIKLTANPELSVTAWFEESVIETLRASEPYEIGRQTPVDEGLWCAESPR